MPPPPKNRACDLHRTRLKQPPGGIRRLRSRAVRRFSRIPAASQSVGLSGPFAEPGGSHLTCPSICNPYTVHRVTHRVHVSRLST